MHPGSLTTEPVAVETIELRLAEQHTANARLYYLDNLRALLMIFGVPYHVGLIYGTGVPWYVSSPEDSAVIGAISGLLHSFRMPAFFIVAAVLSHLVLQKRDPSAWLKARAVRLLVPMAAAALVLSPISFTAGVIAADLAGNGEGFWPWVRRLLTTPGSHWIGHLWFLLALMAFSLATWLAYRTADLRRLDAAVSWVMGRLDHPLLIWGGLAFLSAGYQLTVKYVFYLAERHLDYGSPVWGMVNIEAWFLYFPYFALGLLVARNGALLEIMCRFTLLRLAATTVAAAVYVLTWNVEGLTNKAVAVFAGGWLGVGLSFFVIGGMRAVFDRRNALVAYLVDASFTLYLVHMPVAALVGAVLIPVPAPVVVEYLLVMAIAIAVSLGVHAVVDRSTLLKFLFNGVPFRRS